jgi:hypothetical protein
MRATARARIRMSTAYLRSPLAALRCVSKSSPPAADLVIIPHFGPSSGFRAFPKTDIALDGRATRNDPIRWPSKKAMGSTHPSLLQKAIDMLRVEDRPRLITETERPHVGRCGQARGSRVVFDLRPFFRRQQNGKGLSLNDENQPESTRSCLGYFGKLGSIRLMAAAEITAMSVNGNTT